MPCVRRLGIEIVRGTITRRRLHADVTIGYAEPIPAGQLSHLCVAIQWRTRQGEPNIVLQLRPSGTDLTHFGGEVPARPAARPLGDNVLP